MSKEYGGSALDSSSVLESARCSSGSGDGFEPAELALSNGKEGQEEGDEKSGDGAS